MKTTRGFLLLTMILLMGGCQQYGVRGDFAKVTPAHADRIAVDWADYLVTRYPAGETTFYMAPPAQRGPVGNAFEAMVRANGFAVAYDDTALPDSQTLSIETTEYDQGGLVVVSLRIAPDTLVSRAYSVRPEGVTPASARTQKVEG